MHKTAERRNRALVFSALILVFVLGVVNWRHPVLRFKWQLANTVAFFAIMLLPSSAVLNGLQTMRGWKPLLWIVPTVPVAALSGLMALFTLGEIAFLGVTGRGAAAELVSELRTPNGDLALYRTNGGATTSFGLVLRQECGIAPGIVRVRTLFSAYPAYEATLEVANGRTLRIAVASYRDHQSQSRTVDIPPCSS